MNNILIIGLDKRGCNLARFLREKKLYGEVSGYDLDFDFFKNAVDKEIINNKTNDNFEKIIIRSDFIILNIPLNKYDTIFLKISSFVQKSCIITDINSSKEYIYKNKKIKLNIRKENFIQSNLLFNIDKISKAINKKVLINSSINSNLENINRLSLFWKMYGFDTENMNVNDNDILISKTLHLPFLLKYLVEKKIKGKNFFVNFTKNERYLFEDILSNKDNVVKTLNNFIDLMRKLDFSKETSRVFFDKALKSREKLKKIFGIYGIEDKSENSEGGLFNAINFLLEIIFVGDFIGFREYYYLNMDIFNFSLAIGEEFVCEETISKDKERFLILWEEIIDSLTNFSDRLSNIESLKIKEVFK
jgi:prephenate dehydrogenase